MIFFRSSFFFSFFSFSSSIPSTHQNPKKTEKIKTPFQVRARQEAKRASIEARHGGSLLKVEIGDPLDPFDCWLWFEAGGGGKDSSSSSSNNWTPEDADLLDGVLTAWFMLGRLGGFNSENLQLSQGRGVASRSYDTAPLATAATAVFHDFSPRTDVASPSLGNNGNEGEEEGAIEVQGRWARAWVNLGSADELALDILLNSLATLAAEEVPALSRVIVGGELPWWPVPKVKSQVGSREEGTEGVLPGDY